MSKLIAAAVSVYILLLLTTVARSSVASPYSPSDGGTDVDGKNKSISPFQSIAPIQALRVLHFFPDSCPPNA